MSNSTPTNASGQIARNPFAVILGTNEIASATAVQLHHAGYTVVMSHDPFPPVIRRKMAFHDALFGEEITLDGVTAKPIDSGMQILGGAWRAPSVLITELGLLDLIVLRSLDLLVDARMQKYRVKPDLRQLAHFTIGLGPGFCASENCDFAIETRPPTAGRILQQGTTDEGDRIVRRLGVYGAERLVYAATPGKWHTCHDIGQQVAKGTIVGHLGTSAVRAPLDGVLRGIVRDGTEVPADVKLLEVDGRGRNAKWAGIDARARTIAKAVTKAISLQEAKTEAKRASTPHLVK